MKRKVGYTWRLRDVMAQHRIFTATELVPLLHERGIELSASQVHRLVSGTPERLSLQVMAALCDILSCTPADLVATTAENVGIRKTATGDLPTPPANVAKLLGRSASADVRPPPRRCRAGERVRPSWSGQGVSLHCPSAAYRMNCAKAAERRRSTGPSGFFESRTAMEWHGRARRWATSMQSPSPPLYEDLNQSVPVNSGERVAFRCAFGRVTSCSPP